MKHSRFAAVAAVAVIVAAIGAATAAATGFFHQHRDSTEQAVRNALQDRTPKNVIFFLGDGMGTQEITAARYYQGVNNDAQRRPDAVHRVRHDLVGEAGREPAVPAGLRPRLGLDRDGVGDGPAKRSTSGSRRDRAVPKTSLAPT